MKVARSSPSILIVIMSFQPPEDNQPMVLEPLTSTGHVSNDQAQSTPASRWAVTESSRSFTHKRHGTTHSNHHDTFVPHLLTFNTAAPGHLADLQSWLNLADFPIENMLPLCYTPGDPPTFHPLPTTRLWNGGDASSDSQLEMVHHPVSAQDNGHCTHPTQAQCVRPGHWDFPIDSHLNRVPIRSPRCLGTIPVSILISYRLL